jgi:Ca-activated chloride channel homolog
VLPQIDLDTFVFGTPQYLWLQIVPAALAGLWVLRVWLRGRDARRVAGARLVPVRERYPVTGDLAFWACAIAAASLCLLAVAEPRVRVSAVRMAPADVVLLQDASASMYVRDVAPDRWRRSVQFLRALGEALSWRGDRVALALFAQIAAPQVRLTTDPNALFFFLDHLGERSPFRLEDNPTWDTNIEEGIRWGLRIIDKDEELFGRTGNPKAFVVITDGQAWSGTVATALAEARQRSIPVYVVGVGTTAGGVIPEPPRPDGTRNPPVHSTLDRQSLIQVAVAGGGEYFEIGREPDRDIAFRIVERLQRRSEQAQVVESFEDLYWRFLLAAGVLLCLGTCLLYRPVELWWQVAGAGVGVVVLVLVLG